MKRRQFVRLLGLAPGALAAPWDAAQARSKLLSHLLPGDPDDPPDGSRFIPATCTECPAGCGMLVEVREGRPIKLEGDPDCPLGRGGLCVRGQASLARLYHPERLRQPLERAADGELRPIAWEAALERVAAALGSAAGARDPGFYLAGQTTGALADLVDAFARAHGLQVLPGLELFHHGALRRAHEILFGRREVPTYALGGPDPADLLVTFGADLFESFLHPVRRAREFAEARERGLRWFHCEPGLSMTGCSADRRLALAAGGEPALLLHLLGEIAAGDGATLPAEVLASLPRMPLEEASRRTRLSGDALRELAGALRSARRPLLLCGGIATAMPGGGDAALLAGLLQCATGQIGSTVDFDRPENLDRVGTLIEVDELARGAPATAGDPGLSAGEPREPRVCFLAGLHTLAASPGVRAALERARLVVGLTDFLHESMPPCHLWLPISHGLESSGDAEVVRGRHSRHDPVFRPLFDTRSQGDILLALLGDARTFREYRDGWWAERGLDPRGPRYAERPPERAAPAPRAGAAAPTLRSGAAAAALREIAARHAAAEGAEPQGSTLVLGPSVRMHDGRSRVIPLLHEIPDPVSTVTYGEYAALPESRCRARGWDDGLVVEIVTSAGALRLPLRAQPGLPDGHIVVPIDRALDPGSGLAPEMDPETGELVRVLAIRELRATTDGKRLPVMAGSMEAGGRGILPGDDGGHGGPGGQGGHDGHGAPGGRAASLYPAHDHPLYRWGMVVDLDKCTGCSACVAACYLENNVPLSGPKEHLRGREMSWLRIQPYARRGAGGGRDGLLFLPMMCQHCDMAPCETVCPVYATYHSQEGLNVQVYNRCVGTRYCANNCPYKARRFNWFSHHRPEPLDRLLNPDVSTRPKGVMEKCTFCVQRIRRAKDRARDEDRPVADGEVTPACAQSCPSGAIVFGNLLDPSARVSRLARDARAYRVLAALGTEPAVHYLSRDARHEH